MLDMQVMAWDRTNDRVRKKCIAAGYTKEWQK
jgi:hypothetical protein